MKGLSDTAKALYAVILATIVGGGLAVFGKIGLKVIPPFTFTFLRFAIGGLFLIPLIGKLHRLTLKKMLELGLLSLLSTINLFFFAFGVRLTSATIAQLLYAFVPIVVSLFSIAVLNKKPSIIQFFGIICGLIGIAYLLFGPQLQIKGLLSGGALGNVLITTGTIFYSLYLIYSKKLQKQYSAKTLTGAFIGTTIIVSAVFALFESSHTIHWIYRIEPITYISLLYVGILGTGIFYFLNQYAVQYGSPLIASVIQYTTPPATLIWAMILLQERITPQFIIGAILAYLGAWLVTSK